MASGLDDDLTACQINLRRTERELLAARMTLRDQFALAILPALLAEYHAQRNFNFWDRLWALADMALETRNKQQGEAKCSA